MFDFQEFCAENPLRPPDWRYRVAADRVARGLPLPRLWWDDHTIQTALSLMRRRAATGANAQWFADGRGDELNVALDIYSDRSRLLRFALEARILADMPADEIAEFVGVSPAAVGFYESVCFDVRDRRDHRDFVMCRVINPSPGQSYKWPDSGWKLVGYLGGFSALEIVLNPKPDVGIDHITSAQKIAIRVALLQRIRTLVEGDAELDPRLLSDISKLVAEHAAGDQVPDFARNVDAMLKSIPIQILDSCDARHLYGDDESGVELRPFEQMLIAHGHPPPYLQELKDSLQEIKDFRLRPPDRRSRRGRRDSESAEPVSGSSPPPSEQPPSKPELPDMDFHD